VVKFRSRLARLFPELLVQPQTEHYWEQLPASLTWRPDSSEALLQDMIWLTAYDSETRFVWRGQGNYNWSLVPSLYRRLYQHGGIKGDLHHKTLLLHERNLLAAAEDRSLGDARWGELGIMAILQHHGASTRLLDVTLDPMIALWFAVEGPSEAERDGLVAAFDISRLRQLLRSMPESEVAEYDGSKNSSTRIQVPRWESSLEATYLSDDELAWFEPPQADERIKIQRGLFLVSRRATGVEADFIDPVLRGRSPVGLERFFVAYRNKKPPGRPLAPAFVAFKIRSSFKPALLRHLERSYGYTYETIYPDLQGFAQANSASRAFSSVRRPERSISQDLLPVSIGEDVDLESIPHRPGESTTIDQVRGLHGLKISESWIRYWRAKSTGLLDESRRPVPKYAALILDQLVVEVFLLRHESWRVVARKDSTESVFTCDLDVASHDERAEYLSAQLIDTQRKVIRVPGRGWYVEHLGDPPKLNNILRSVQLY
jgi:hypothetical protein